MKNLFKVLSLLLLICAFSCADKEESIEIEDEVFIFGSYNGFCQGNCAHLFKYENGQVFRDEMDRFDDSNFKFSSNAEADLLDAAYRLFNQFPELLKESDQETYGCPGCLDQSTLYVSIGDGEGVRSWRLDSIVQEDWPQELKDYVTLLISELEKIIIF